MSNVFKDNSVHSVNDQRGRVEVVEDRNVLYTQSIPSDTWVIEHKMGKFPNITVIDSAGNKVVGNEEHVNDKKVILTFNGAFSGKATLN